ncbi:MAG: transglutaminase domain-containing protein [Candidatus Vogelbacteria bacterium]
MVKNKLPKNNIRKVKISDYLGNQSRNLQVWSRSEKVPKYFWNRFKDITPEITIGELLTRIDKELRKIYGKKKDLAQSFADSRFTPLPNMLKRGMVSCGALSIIFATILRKFGIPVKLVHGRLNGQRGENRHAWLKLYNSRDKKWCAIDPTQWHRNFAIKPSARQIKIYADWKELRKDYDKGKF